MNRMPRRTFLARACRVGSLGVLMGLFGCRDGSRTAPTPSPSATLAVPASGPSAILPGPTPTPGPLIMAEADRALQGVAELTQVAKLVGEKAINDTPQRFGLYGADLGSMFDKDDKLYMVFGDSYGCCIPGTGGPGNAGDWRKNCMAIITDRNPAHGLLFADMITDRPGHARELLPRGKFDKTVIPTYGVAIGSRMVLHYMAVLAWGKPGEWALNEAGLAYSDDDGQTWTKDANVKWEGQSDFGQVALVKAANELYLFGIPGGRFGGVKLAKVGQDAVLDKGAYRYLTGVVGGQPQWAADESTATLIVPAPVGELSVLWNAYLGRWLMTYLDESRAALMIREARELWGPWSAPLPLASGAAYPGLYGAYMHPWLTEHDGEVIYFAMSQWGPYSVFLMRARMVKR